MSTLLSLVRSFVPGTRRYFRPSDEGGLGPERPVALTRDLHAAEREAKSNVFGKLLLAVALRDKLLPWQVRASTRITLLVPPTASLILLAVDYFKYSRAIPFNFADFLAAFFLFAIPVGYGFGAIPALLAASLYCTLLTADSRLQRRLLTRGGVGAICGGLVSSVYFRELLHIDWGIYGLTGALVVAALSLSSSSTGKAARQ